jgi:SAM-dependent methyltransferase
MPANWFHSIINNKEVTETNGIWVSNALLNKKLKWSFAEEWKEHAKTNQQKTWDWTATQRLEQFYIETKTDKNALKDKIILDAGCGNGLLTKAIADAGASLVGIDLHPYLPSNLISDSLQFVQCDFDNPPFYSSTFDIIIANGTIHHTKNTFHSFQSLAGLVKEHGKFYVWVYKRPTGLWKNILLVLLDFFRFFISSMPAGLQKFFVQAFTRFFFILSRIRKGQNSLRTKEEIRINVYDAFTPRYRHYHNPIEVAGWFNHCGFDEPVLSHWDNPVGFGMVAVKKTEHQKTAGANFVSKN